MKQQDLIGPEIKEVQADDIYDFQRKLSDVEIKGIMKIVNENSKLPTMELKPAIEDKINLEILKPVAIRYYKEEKIDYFFLSCNDKSVYMKTDDDNYYRLMITYDKDKIITNADFEGILDELRARITIDEDNPNKMLKSLKSIRKYIFDIKNKYFPLP